MDYILYFNFPIYYFHLWNMYFWCLVATVFVAILCNITTGTEKLTGNQWHTIPLPFRLDPAITTRFYLIDFFKSQQ